MYVKMVVACSNSNSAGQPELHSCSVECSDAEYELGRHYDLAHENATLNGFGGPMIAFDSKDPAGKQLDGLDGWMRKSDDAPDLDDETIANFMLFRIENNDLALEDIPMRLARFGLMNPADFVAEMAERMENSEWDERPKLKR